MSEPLRFPYSNPFEPSDAECAAVFRKMARDAFGGRARPLPGPLSGDGANAYGRGPTPINWSNGPVFVPPKTYLGVTVAGARVLPVLKVEGTGVPRYWTVQGSASLEFGGPTAGSTLTTVNQWMRVRWTVGRASYVADFDIAAGGWCFGLNADSLELSAVNDDITWPLEVVATVGPAQPCDDYRAPRRTVRVLGGNFIIDYPVPRFAQQVSVYTLCTALRICEWRDAVGNISAQFSVPSTNIVVSPLVLDVPMGAAVLRLAASASQASTPTAAVFRLGF